MDSIQILIIIEIAFAFIVVAVGDYFVFYNFRKEFYT